MYSGTTFHTKSGRVMGVHQKIDRVARRHIKPYLPRAVEFPRTKDILHFEGTNGPDGLKRKSPGVDEPWHFIDPQSPEKSPILADIRDHLINLTTALSRQNYERSAFEAAWLAHAITDGLTPAHHVPYEAALAELRGGEPHTTRTSRRQKAVMPGSNRRDLIRNNWKYWGAKGLMNMHLQFEFGVAASIATMRFDQMALDDEWQAIQTPQHLQGHFVQSVLSIDGLGMYDEFALKGWNQHLARETKDVLVPEIIRTVMCAWRVAALAAEKKR